MTTNILKTKVRTYGEKIITDFDSQGVSHDGIKCKCYLAITIYDLFNYK